MYLYELKLAALTLCKCTLCFPYGGLLNTLTCILCQSWCFVFLALVRPVKVLKVWPELAPGQLSPLPLLSCGGPGGQVRLSEHCEDIMCPSGGDDSCCHGNGAQQLLMNV